MSSNITAILKVILYIGIFSQLLPLVFFLLYKFRSKEKELRVIFYYIIYCILNESISIYLRQSPNIFFLFSIYTVVEFSFFCLFYYYISAKTKKIIFLIWIGFIIIAAIDFFFVNKMGGFDSFTSGTEALLIIGLCIYYLFMQIKGSNSLHIYSTTNFWIIITFLIYVSGTFFLYIMTEMMVNNFSFKVQYTYINSAFNVLKNVLLSIAMFMKSNELKPQSKRNYEWDDYIPLK